MDVVYRVLRDDEEKTYKWKGLTAKDTSAKITVFMHVGCGGSSCIPSQYISTCGSLDAAREFARCCQYKPKTIVSIDTDVLSRIQSKTILTDLRNDSELLRHIPPGSQETETAIHRVRKFQEVIIEGHVPPECMQHVEIYSLPHIVYRVLRNKEVTQLKKMKGLNAKNPASRVTFLKFLAKSSSSFSPPQYISTCASLDVAREFALRSPFKPDIVSIDIKSLLQDKPDTKVIDLTNDKVLLQYIPPVNMEAQRAIHLAKMFEEVLIQGSVPPEYVEFVPPYASLQIVYRVLRIGEVGKYRAEGLLAKNPYATVTVFHHVAYGSSEAACPPSQYISTCATLVAAKRFATHTINRPVAIVRIDIDLLLRMEPDTNLINLTDVEVLHQYIPDGSKSTQKAIKFARKYDEVLIQGFVPPQCVQYVEHY